MDGLLEKDKANEKILKEKQKGEKLIQRYTDQNKMKHDQKVEAKPRKFSVVSMMRLPSFKNAAPAPQMNKMAKEILSKSPKTCVSKATASHDPPIDQRCTAKVLEQFLASPHTVPHSAQRESR